jgi:hypothetical protein
MPDFLKGRLSDVLAPLGSISGNGEPCQTKLLKNSQAAKTAKTAGDTAKFAISAE